MVAAGMKMRQAGLINKPLYVVPNHMLNNSPASVSSCILTPDC